MYKCADIQKNQQVKKKYTIQLGENELVLKVVLCSSSEFELRLCSALVSF